MRGLKRNQINTPDSIYENDYSNKINIFGDSESVTPTYRRRPRILKNSAKFSKSNSQGIGPKIGYPQNQQDSLNHFQFFEIKKSLIEKSSVDF